MTWRPDGRSGTVLAVCGLAIEERLAAGDGVRTVAGGGRSAALADTLERAVADGVVAIVSFGIAGALVPTLRPGTLIVAARVAGPDATHATHRPWSAELLKRIPGAIEATLAGVDVIAADPIAKRRLQVDRGADAVDMESHVAAAVAAAHGLPFVALRAIADPLERSMPPAARIAMRDDGRIALPAVLAAIARAPGQLPELLRIGADTRTALRRLGDARRRLGRGLGYLDLDQLPVHVV